MLKSGLDDMLSFMTQFYILIPALIVAVCVVAHTLIQTERRHLEQREIQRAKWNARVDEVSRASSAQASPAQASSRKALGTAAGD